MAEFELARLGWHVITTIVAALAFLFGFLARRTAVVTNQIGELKERVKVLEKTSASQVSVVKAIGELKGELKKIGANLTAHNERIDQLFEASREAEKQSK